MTIQPETCSDCEECVFSWDDNKWHCGDASDRPILDNDIYTSVHYNCHLRKERVL